MCTATESECCAQCLYCTDVGPHVQLLAALLASQLRVHRGDFASCSPVASAAFTQLCCMLKDSTPVVLKAACEALQYCLPPLTQSTEPQRGALNE